VTARHPWGDHANEMLEGMLRNLVAEGRLMAQHGLDATPQKIVDGSRELLMDMIDRSLPLARLMDGSDLVLHAEGSAVHASRPMLSAFNWLSNVAERTMRRLSAHLFDMSEKDSRRLSRGLDLRLTGMAPGSLYLGFSVADAPEDLLFAGDEPVLATIRESVHLLPATAAQIGRASISPEINELLPDPAQRDLSLEALFALSPTGKRGISLIDIGAPGVASQALSPRERVVLKDALARPELSNRKRGSFVGSLHEIDLASNRFHLREVDGIGSLRCVLLNLTKEKGKSLLGEWVKVEGEYEVDRHGKPRLMIVHHATPLPSARQEPLKL
jgi:hypothetical protein